MLSPTKNTYPGGSHCWEPATLPFHCEKFEICRQFIAFDCELQTDRLVGWYFTSVLWLFADSSRRQYSTTPSEHYR